MKYSIPLVAVLCLGLLVGCKTTPPPMTKALVKSTVQIGVSVGVNESPEAIPYLRLAAPVVCEAARGTNLQPAFIVEALQTNAAANALKNPQAILIFNSAFSIYSGLYEAFGAEEVESRPQLRSFLEGVCEGVLAGLPPISQPPLSNASRALNRRNLPPHIH